MSNKLKLYLGRKVLDSLREKSLTTMQIKSLIRIGDPTTQKHAEMNIPLKVLEHHLGTSNVNEILKIRPDDVIKSIHYVPDKANKKISFEINRNTFIKDVIENGTFLDNDLLHKNIVIEFSSPNIAKPFHVGHLRSTIIGNFLANLHKYLNNDVVKLNYLGDWGTQFGFIKVGAEKLKYSDQAIKNDPIKLLYESYVYANKLAETDPLIHELARYEFTKLETGSTEDINNWKTFMNYTVDELRTTYNRLGIMFDEYNYESMYSLKDINNVISLLHQKKILVTQPDGKQVAQLNNRKVSIIKSDGTTLYLTRDIAAAIDRFEKFKFDKMYYVVDIRQNDHFNALKDILYKLDMQWADRLKHVTFGSIRGMSTRKGTAIFLKDILNETRDLMVKKQIESPNTKVPITDTQTSDILGISCVIINDLKQRRQKDYNFNWDSVLQVQGDSGIKLQYTHARLCSLEKHCSVIPAQECIPELLEEPEVTALVCEIARFHDVLYKAQEQLEACILVTYLFHLCNHINRAFKVLQVKNQETNVASQRLLLFNQAKEILQQGMSILGLTPLEEM